MVTNLVLRFVFVVSVFSPFVSFAKCTPAIYLVSGKIVDSKGRPLAKKSFKLRFDDIERVTGDFVTDESGRFSGEIAFDRYRSLGFFKKLFSRQPFYCDRVAEIANFRTNESGQKPRLATIKVKEHKLEAFVKEVIDFGTVRVN